MKNHTFTTISVCPECCKDLPAVVTFEKDGVWMTKDCTSHGGSHTRTMVDRDPAIYARLRQNIRASIYPGHFIDVTTRCNLACSYCYYPCGESEDPSIEEIVQEAACYDVPAYLTGGEPTLRGDLPELMGRLRKYHGSAIPTNGAGLLDHDYLCAVLANIGRYDKNTARIALSYHQGLNEKVFHRVLENVRELNERISGPLFVLRDYDDLDRIISITRQYQDSIDFTRVHIATDIWDAEDYRQIFMSDIIKHMGERAQREHTSFEWDETTGSTYWLHTRFDGLRITFARWMTKYDLDLCYVPRNPSYRAKNGATYFLLHGFMVNEAMQRGWCCGRRLAIDDACEVTHG